MAGANTHSAVQTLALVARGGVESVVESMVSVMEAHTPASRGLLNQKRIEDEILGQPSFKKNLFFEKSFIKRKPLKLC